MQDVIAAIATGGQRAAIGIIRMTGDGCVRVAEQVFRAKNGRPLSQQPPRTLVFGTLHGRDGRVLDEILAVRTPGPRSYTGEDCVELQCHGAPAVLAAAMDALFAAGARQAGPGEFTKRAFFHGRMDLTQAEAVIDLIDAETAEQAQNAAGQLGGALRRRLDPIYDALTDICAHFHAVLDYPDEEIPPFRLADFAQTLRDAAARLDALLATVERGRFLKRGVRAVILGRPNAGKSSLLNLLAGYDRVIVTPTPGTTRDAVEETVRLGGVLLRLVDTAGIRQTSDEIEAMGVARAEAAAQEADLALFVFDGAQPLTEEDARAMAAARQAGCAIAVQNKSDLGVLSQQLPDFDGFDELITLSAKTGEGLDALACAVQARFSPDASDCDGGILVNVRQADAARRASAALREALASLSFTPDAVLVDVEDAMAAIGELTGRSVREDVTARIFERFCVGK